MLQTRPSPRAGQTCPDSQVDEARRAARGAGLEARRPTLLKPAGGSADPVVSAGRPGRAQPAPASMLGRAFGAAADTGGHRAAQLRFLVQRSRKTSAGLCGRVWHGGAALSALQGRQR